MVIPTQPVEALMYFHTTMSSYATPSERDEGARGRISQLDMKLHLIKFGSDFSYNLHIYVLYMHTNLPRRKPPSTGPYNAYRGNPLADL